MLEVATYLTLALAALLMGGLLLLPIVVGVHVRRTDHPGATAFRLDGSLFAGLIGVSVHQSGATRRLYPLWHRWTIGPGRVLGKRVAMKDRAIEVDPGKENQSAGGQSTTSIRSLIVLAHRVREMSRLLVRPGLQLLGSLRYVARLRRLSLRGHLGLLDPATTGSTCAVLHGVRAFDSQRVSIDLTPDFVTPRVEGHLHLIVHLYLGYALACIVRFGLRVGLGWLALRLRTFMSSHFSSKE